MISRTASAKAPDTCDLTLTIRGDRYRLRPIPGVLGRAWRLRKLGTLTVHRVSEGPGGPSCDCGDQVWRTPGRGSPCKHIRALRALGLIERPG